MRRSRGTRAVPAVVAVALVLLTGCASNPKGQDLCTKYSDLQSSVAALKAAPPIATGSAEDLAAAAAELSVKAAAVKAKLDQLQRVSEGQLDTSIGALRLRIDELRQTLATARSQDAKTLTPEVKDAMDAVSTSYAQLSSVLNAQCQNVSRSPQTQSQTS